ncbi:hypothetical protein HRbin11_00786 [bacterium HR11]|nr:hypothetical protein HRbin11_00786 [bacterium HR11]
MRDADLQALIDTVDVLRLLALRGRQEVREFTRWLVVFGVYMCVNVVVHVLWGRPYWFESLFPAFWLATVPVAGFLLPSLVWPAAAGLTYGAYTWSRSGVITVGVSVLAIALGLIAIYGYGVWTGRYRPARPLKLSIAPKVGWSWSVVMGGMALLQAVLRRHGGLDAGDYAALWGYAAGLGLFISGIMAPGFFVLGVVGIWGIPLLSLWTPQGAYLMHGGLGLLMALYALWLRRTGDHGHSHRP